MDFELVGDITDIETTPPAAAYGSCHGCAACMARAGGGR
jgi:hypothetical protein